eukprot:TRINITY_DN93644_c0_g1_i1.p1 TRINITY_DN93644_c0_g1~~TRINITY_DN93644_c0_g1_i1.p1  ORF type:complete len:231 (+),score=62.63 TRINITY_DN93644_c0_g1_i1:178-870(+)
MAFQRSASSSSRRHGGCLSLLIVGASAAVLLCTLEQAMSFVAPRVSSNSYGRQRSLLQQNAKEGFEEKTEGEVKVKKEPKKKIVVAITQEQLEADHGDKWEMVDNILKGKKASSPEAIMRARFTALKFKDPQFLAATERDETQSTKQRAEQWAVTLGIKEKNIFDSILNFGQKIEALQQPVSFEVVKADDDDVEFKIRCKDGVLHEKSRFVSDRKYGYVYSGLSEFGNWE